MTISSETVFFDRDIETAIIGLLKEAKEEVILVSPYNRYWHPLREAIGAALQRKVDVTVVYREREGGPDIDWLRRSGATVQPVRRLHAKVFINESSVIISSMNLNESSSLHSREVAIRLTGNGAADAVRDYVVGDLLRLDPRKQRRQVETSRRWTSSLARVALGGLRETLKMVASASDDGPPNRKRGSRACKDCGAEIPYMQYKPRCLQCYKDWRAAQRAERRNAA